MKLSIFLAGIFVFISISFVYSFRSSSMLDAKYFVKQHVSSRFLKNHNQGQMQMSISSLVGSASAVAGVVAFHEAGHFLAAKLQGMKIQSFNIGYGPKLFAFNDTSNTEFALRVLPFGGYVAFPVNVETDDEGEIIKELDDPDLLQNRYSI